MTDNYSQQYIHFVTGRLAEFALQKELKKLSAQIGFQYSVDALPITVAALMTPDWIAKKISVPAAATTLILPGYCQGDLSNLAQIAKIPIIQGPRDLRKLAHFFGLKQRGADDYGDYDIQIIAEINHAPKMSLPEILETALKLKQSGANIIDIGCIPGETWSGVEQCVRMLVDQGLHVSIDSLNPSEIAAAANAGAELVLSVNSTNRQFAPDWGIECVVIPDQFENLAGLEETIEYLSARDVPLRIDTILEPIGFGFGKSLQRYMDMRAKYPDAEMMMGIGNITELTDVDSAGLNVLLLGICQEFGIRSVLTTQVINWARSSVKECDLARRLVHYSINNRVPPKHLETNLLTLRDPELTPISHEDLETLALQIRDNNYRIFATDDDKEIHLIGSQLHLHDQDPFIIFDQLLERKPVNLDASHAFYLGYEMCKAITALQLGKEYQQDEALNWGHLTQSEKNRHRLKKKSKQKKPHSQSK